MASADGDPPAVRYRRLAQQCLTALETTIHSETRATLVRLAEIWWRLANEHELGSRPVVTQQQQQLPKQPDQADE